MAFLASHTRRFGAGPLAIAAAVPLILLHKQYQPSVTLGAVDVTAADVAIAVVVVLAVRSAQREGTDPLRPARSVWIVLALFLAWLVASLLWARHVDPDYAFGSHVVSAGKFVEYALLAPAVPLLLRRADDLVAPFCALLAWSGFLTLIAALQFVGVVDEFEGRRPLQREPSYVGVHELGAVSGVVLVTAFVAIVLGRRRRSGVAATLAGGIGIALAAALDSIGGIAAAAATVWVLARNRAPVPGRRTIVLVALVLAVAGAAVSLRGSAVTAFLEFVGVRKQDEDTRTHVQSYAHRTLLGYIGVRIWLDHPVIGAGWQESMEPASFTPHLDEAHARFPDEPAEAFPSAEHRWGVQNGVIQALADLGVVGLALLLGTLAAAARLAARAVDRATEAALAALGGLWVSFAVFTGVGLLAGSPIDALLWLMVGLAAAAAAFSPLTPRR